MSRTLLLADGSVTIQRVVELTFAHEDIRVTAVSDGRKAIQMLETELPDVVLADVDLPEVDGYALAAHMRRVPRLKNVPLLLLAGAFEPVDHQKARDVGSDGVIIKPFEPQVVVNRVKELIDQRDRAASPASSKAAKSEEPAEQPGPKAVPPPPPPAPEPARAAPKPEVSFPRAAAAEAAPAPLDLPVTPEPLELPSRPIWDIRGSVAQGPAPLPPLQMPAAPAHAAATLPPVAPPLPSVPAPPKVTLANAFTALLAAEQSMPTGPAPVTMNEASIEDAVRRVLVRMTDDLVRRIVVDTAERLIREEIERIKANPD
jgi:CheY-like chemotaxis protein